MSKIFVVNDNPSALHRLNTKITELNHTFMGTDKPLEAFDLAIEFQPNLILVNRLMPDLNGFKLSKKIGRNQE